MRWSVNFIEKYFFSLRALSPVYFERAQKTPLSKVEQLSVIARFPLFVKIEKDSFSDLLQIRWNSLGEEQILTPRIKHHKNACLFLNEIFERAFGQEYDICVFLRPILFFRFFFWCFTRARRERNKLNTRLQR